VTETDLLGRMRRFNVSTGALTWNYRSAAEHPDRCVCQVGVTPHKHYDAPPYKCARCSVCKHYQPAEPSNMKTERSKTKATKRYTAKADNGRWIFRADAGEPLSGTDFDASYVLQSLGIEVQHDDEIEVSMTVVSRMTLKRERV
jgi:hypothetical protein